MCMKISKEDLLRINKGFNGGLRSSSSIDFAIECLMRAILVDHPFSDGNKRTASFLAFQFADEIKKQVDKNMLVHHIISIAKKNILDIRNIEWRLKNAIN